MLLALPYPQGCGLGAPPPPLPPEGLDFLLTHKALQPFPSFAKKMHCFYFLCMWSSILRLAWTKFGPPPPRNLAEEAFNVIKQTAKGRLLEKGYALSATDHLPHGTECAARMFMQCLLCLAALLNPDSFFAEAYAV